MVKPVRATVFPPGPGADNPGLAKFAIDGDPDTVWTTDPYKRPDAFPRYKAGFGLLLQLPKPTALSAVTIEVGSNGTDVQIRSARSATPDGLDDTTELTPPTPVHRGTNRIPIEASTKTSYVLVWISKLGTTNRQNQATLSEITLQAAG